MRKHAVLTGCIVSGILVAACSDSNGPKELGPPSQLVAVQGNNQSAPANTQLPQQIKVAVQDANGNTLGAGHTITFSIIAGGGSLVGTTTATTDESGTVTAPAWKLGLSNVPQTMRAQLGSITGDVNAAVATLYDIVVRYFGDPMSDANKALFEGAAARLEALITGDVVNATANLDLSSPQACDTPGLPTVNETVDDIVIYAAITSMDGPGSILAQASPCVGRGSPTMVVYGFMKFDVADFGTFSNVQEVILHEMLHVLGSGTLWEIERSLITGKGGSDPRFTGPLARQACVDLGAAVTCANSVPLENQGGTGTRDFHWRETTFGNELMTGFYNQGANPLSLLTLASMADLTFVVNNAAVDSYTFVGVTQMSTSGQLSPGWEQIGTLRGKLRPDGRVERITFK